MSSITQLSLEHLGVAREIVPLTVRIVSELERVFEEALQPQFLDFSRLALSLSSSSVVSSEPLRWCVLESGKDITNLAEALRVARVAFQFGSTAFASAARAMSTLGQQLTTATRFVLTSTCHGYTLLSPRIGWPRINFLLEVVLRELLSLIVNMESLASTFESMARAAANASVQLASQGTLEDVFWTIFYARKCVPKAQQVVETARERLTAIEAMIDTVIG